ncbi:MAG: bifunctional DNA-formamidopyrimidine glycosylase/DNA-(apurinic or apyrimidinic site) lyase [bacterium]|nr:bifunctional DNA-formamidopyrimidine glycosylase/DNA-(apurinic or apyrimidinic site) lyase [bacterium]
MPELPEVETIRRQLATRLVGKKIKKVEIKFAGLVKAPVKDFVRVVEGAKILNIRRRAKMLIFDLSNGWSLLVHLKMTGQLIVDGPPGGEASQPGMGEPYVIYIFNDGSRLRHYDFRKFGYVKLIKTGEVENNFKKEKLGPELLEKDFTLEKFRSLLIGKPKAKIKPLLMDQTFIAGVGNIYAQEACFFAKVLPTWPAGALNDKEIKEVYQGLRKILQNSIEDRGTSADSYVDAFGKQGDYLPKLKVYGRGGEKCSRCGAILKSAKLAGRGTVWCPRCQK